MSLLLAVTMLILTSIITVSAEYDPTIRPEGIPNDSWTFQTVYHWVVRGEDLAGIASRYGTTVDELKFYNKAYFDDLANRNKTTGLNIQLENGVRLFIYHMVTVKHYVRRGETLNMLANGLLTYGVKKDPVYDGYFAKGYDPVDCGFTIITTAQAIKNENQRWFDSLARLNTTRGTTHELEESYDMWNIWRGTDDLGRPAGPVFDSPDAGAPLFISVPVQYKRKDDNDRELDFTTARGSDGKTAPWYNREVLTYMANKGEIEGNPSLKDYPSQITPYLVDSSNTLPNDAKFGYNNQLPSVTGWTSHVNTPDPTLYYRLVDYKIPGWSQR